MKKLRIGLVGAGNIAKVHLESYKQVENAQIIAVCDFNEKVLKDTSEQYGIEKTYSSLTEMINSEELDAVDVCVWNCHHAECTIEALNAGLHVLCEKPMATNAKEAQDMINAAKKNNKLLMIGFVMRFGEEGIVAKDFIDNDYLGDIYYSKATYLRKHGAPGGWFTDKSLSAGGPVIDLGVHVIDLTRYLMGKPKALSVFASTDDSLKNRKNLKTEVEWKPDAATDADLYDVEDFCVAMIKYEGNKTTLLETSYSINAESVTNTQLYGTKGGMVVDPIKMKIYTEVNDYLADITPDIANRKNAKDLFVTEMEHFVNCALGKEECIATAEDGLEIMKIIDAIYESARTGHEVIIK